MNAMPVCANTGRSFFRETGRLFTEFKSLLSIKAALPESLAAFSPVET